jgi:hypothetical protein
MTDRFSASRLTGGNLIFPARVSVEPDGIHYSKSRLFGAVEETINYRQISSLRLETGIFFCTITIETSGGSQPVIIHGLWKDDGRRIRDAVQQVQSAAKP